jgi:hypothetical protein
MRSFDVNTRGIFQSDKWSCLEYESQQSVKWDDDQTSTLVLASLLAILIFTTGGQGESSLLLTVFSGEDLTPYTRIEDLQHPRSELKRNMASNFRWGIGVQILPKFQTRTDVLDSESGSLLRRDVRRCWEPTPRFDVFYHFIMLRQHAGIH